MVDGRLPTNMAALHELVKCTHCCLSSLPFYSILMNMINMVLPPPYSTVCCLAVLTRTSVCVMQASFSVGGSAGRIQYRVLSGCINTDLRMCHAGYFLRLLWRPPHTWRTMPWVTQS